LVFLWLFDFHWIISDLVFNVHITKINKSSSTRRKKYLETVKSILKEYSDPKLWKFFLEFKNIILKENLSKKYKNFHENFSSVRISMVLGLLEPWSSEIYRKAVRGRSISWSFWIYWTIFSSKMSKQSFLCLVLEYSLIIDLEICKHLESTRKRVKMTRLRVKFTRQIFQNTRSSVISIRSSVISTRRVRFSHAWVWFPHAWV
jgi:hypothetical protein